MSVGRPALRRFGLGRPRSRRAPARVVALVLGTAVAAGSWAVPAAPSNGAAAVGTTRGHHGNGAGNAWTVYHGSPSGSGVSAARLDLRAPRHAWTSKPLGGQIYGEPLVATGLVIVATERDVVDALRARNGRVAWSTRLGSPVPANRLPCGDISPAVGVTGTPVVDPARREVFLVADELVRGRPSHHLFGLDIRSGRILLDVAVDPPGSDPTALLQRTGLALDRGSVVFGFGGNYGDCGDYHGWVVSVPQTGAASGIRRYETDAAAGERQGAVWMGGAAPEVSADGDIWAAVGNGSVVRSGTPYDGSDAVIALDRGLRLLQHFAPADWYADNRDDLDLGSTAPALVRGDRAVQAGKSGTAYLLDTSSLGGTGGELASLPVCDGGTAGGGAAVKGLVVYLPCRSGVEAVRVGGRTLTVLWKASNSQAAGPPIVAGGEVWSIGGSTLFALHPRTGTVDATLEIGSNANHFPTASVGAGLLLATGGTGGDEVVAFTGGR